MTTRFAATAARVWISGALVGALVAGCDPRADGEGPVARAVSAVTGSPNADILGFESASVWTAGVGTVGLSSNHVQGAFSLAVAPVNYTLYTSAALAISAPFEAVTFQLWMPATQPNPFWLGQAQVFVESPSRNLFNAFCAAVELTGLPTATWNTLTFPVPQNVQAQLTGVTVTDLIVRVALNVPGSPGTYLLDDMRLAGSTAGCVAAAGSARTIAIPGATPGFCIDETEVTKQRYQAWLAGNPSTAGQGTACAWNTSFVPSCAWPAPPSEANRPVVCVDWCDARAYCAAQGKHLCGRVGGGALPFSDFLTLSSEWFSACRGGGTASTPELDGRCNGWTQGPRRTSDVGSFDQCRNPQGAFDLVGNVSEWIDSCAATSGSSDACRVRGGAFTSAEQRLSCSDPGDVPRGFTHDSIGFRCCAAFNSCADHVKDGNETSVDCGGSCPPCSPPG